MANEINGTVSACASFTKGIAMNKMIGVIGNNVLILESTYGTSGYFCEGARKGGERIFIQLRSYP